MTSLSASIPPIIVRTADEWRAELLADLRSLVRAGDQLPTAGRLYSCPGVLGRLAALVAGRVGTRCDLLVGSVADSGLVTAVSLHTGMRMLILDPGSSERPRHCPAHAVAVAYSATPEGKAVTAAAQAAGIVVAQLVTLFSTEPVADDSVPQVPIFAYPDLRFRETDIR